MATPDKFVGQWKILHWKNGPTLPEELVKVSMGPGQSLLEIESPADGIFTLKWLDTEGKRCTIDSPLTPCKDEFDDDELQVGPTTIKIGDDPASSIKLRSGVGVKFMMVVTLNDEVGDGNPGTIIAEAHPRPPGGEES